MGRTPKNNLGSWHFRQIAKIFGNIMPTCLINHAHLATLFFALLFYKQNEQNASFTKDYFGKQFLFLYKKKKI